MIGTKWFHGCFGKEVEMEYSFGINLGLMNIGACEFQQLCKKDDVKPSFTRFFDALAA